MLSMQESHASRNVNPFIAMIANQMARLHHALTYTCWGAQELCNTLLQGCWHKLLMKLLQSSVTASSQSKGISAPLRSLNYTRHPSSEL